MKLIGRSQRLPPLLAGHKGYPHYCCTHMFQNCIRDHFSIQATVLGSISGHYRQVSLYPLLCILYMYIHVHGITNFLPSISSPPSTATSPITVRGMTCDASSIVYITRRCLIFITTLEEGREYDRLTYSREFLLGLPLSHRRGMSR